MTFTTPLPMLEPGDWLTTGSLRLDATLSLPDLDSSALLHDARTLLTHVVAKRQLHYNQNGRLDMAIVTELSPALRWVESSLDVGLGLAPGEGAYRGLSVARTLLTGAGVILARAGWLQPRKRARTLMQDDRAGELFATLFIELFRDTGPHFLDDFDDEERGLQQAMPSVLWLLAQQNDDWQSAEQLASSTWPLALRAATGPAVAYGERLDSKPLSYALRVLDPLVAFGLMERRNSGGEATESRREYRTTTLFNRFLRFETA